MKILIAIVLIFALLASWWALNAFINLMLYQTDTSHHEEEDAIISEINARSREAVYIDIIAALLWGFFYYLTH